MANQMPTNIVYFGPKANCTLAICPIETSVYGYRPSLAPNVLFTVLFSIAFVVHTCLGIRWRRWFFMACMLMGCICAVGGYIGRIFMYYNPWSFGAFMLQTLGVGVVPVYYCAAIYVTLSDAVRSLAPNLSRFHPSLYYCVFLCSDAVSLTLQAIGAGMAAAAAGISDVGVKLAIIGLASQLVTMVVFCGLFADFLIRFSRLGHVQGAKSPRWYALAVGSIKLNTFFAFLSLGLLLITVRSAYRLYELHEGFRGKSLKSEGLFIGMEGVLVVLSTYCLMVGHPGLVFKRQTARDVRPESSSYLERIPQKPASR